MKIKIKMLLPMHLLTGTRSYIFIQEKKGNYNKKIILLEKNISLLTEKKELSCMECIAWELWTQFYMKSYNSPYFLLSTSFSKKYFRDDTNMSEIISIS